MAIISAPLLHLAGIICLIAMMTLSKKIYAFASLVNPKLFRFGDRNQPSKNAPVPPPCFLNQIPVGIMRLGTEAEILECNIAGRKLLHRSEAQLYGQTAFNATWQVIQADGTNFTNPKILLTPQENLVLGISDGGTWLLVNTLADDSGEKVICTFSDITERYKAEFRLRQSQSRLKRQNEVFLALAKSKTLVQGDLNAALDKITETAATTLEVERVSIWLYNQEHTAIHCLNLYEQSSNRHSSGTEIAVADYPLYFQALTAERTIAAVDAYTDPRTYEFAPVYLSSVSITSMLDATIWLEGEMVGVVCHEHTASKRQWTLEEENFAGALADLITLALEANQRHKARVALRQSEAKFHNLAANVPGMIYQFLLHPDGSMAFPYVSPYCLEIFEVEPEQVQQNAFLIVAQIHPADKESFQTSVAESAQTLQPWIWSGRFITPSGKLSWISGASRPEKLPNGSIIWDGLLMDISKRKQAETELAQAKDELEIRVEQRTKELQDTNQQLLVEITERAAVELALNNAALSAQTRSQELQKALEQLQKTQSQLIQSEKMSSLGQMVAGIAHEINNPISFISGNLVHANEYTLDLLSLLRSYEEHYPQYVPAIEKLKQTIELEFLIDDLPELFTSMQVGAQRIKNIVLSLRNFSRLDEADMKCVNLHEGIDSTLLILQHRLNATHQPIQIIKKYGNLPKVECYPGKLNQVFMNILANAIDALNTSIVNPTICISTEITLNTARITIADNGHGMSKDTIDRIFDPFFTTKPVGSGTGLGLSISYQIVIENHKGAIACKSETGKGSEFTIEIPIHQKKYRRGGFTNNI
jgi:signal transduction histidine kinase